MTKSSCEGRFILTFDDGPHANTVSILKRLAHNPVQQGIKAMFFVQTRNREAGRSPLGRSLLQREHADGHVLGLHTGTAGHVSHTSLSQSDLDRSLQNGTEDIRFVTNNTAMFVRPPYWRYNSDTHAGYTRHGLHMILSDVKAYDGVNWGQHVFRRWNFRSQLDAIRRRMQLHGIPTVDGTTPIIVTFHDTNNYTTSRLIEYLDLLIDEADRVGLRLDKKPFYDNASEIKRAALRRAVHRIDTAEAEARPAEASLICQHK